MKRLLLGIIIGITFTSLIGAGINEYVVSKKTAEVVTIQNLKVFTDCDPVMDYEYLGTVKVRISLTDQYNELRDILLKNAKKEYPNCEGIIIHSDKADVIKFK